MQLGLFQFSLLFTVAGESVNASAGLGFNGYNEKGQVRWDLIDNVDIYKVEVCDFFLKPTLRVVSFDSRSL